MCVFVCVCVCTCVRVLNYSRHPLTSYSDCHHTAGLPLRHGEGHLKLFIIFFSKRIEYGKRDEGCILCIDRMERKEALREGGGKEREEKRD